MAILSTRTLVESEQPALHGRGKFFGNSETAPTIDPAQRLFIRDRYHLLINQFFRARKGEVETICCVSTACGGIKNTGHNLQTSHPRSLSVRCRRANTTNTPTATYANYSCMAFCVNHFRVALQDGADFNRSVKMHVVERQKPRAVLEKDIGTTPGKFVCLWIASKRRGVRSREV